MDDKNIALVQGALKQLEKWVPTAGLALLRRLLPLKMDYDGTVIRENPDKKFWKRAWHTKSSRKMQSMKNRDGS